MQSGDSRMQGRRFRWRWASAMAVPLLALVVAGGRPCQAQSAAEYYEKGHNYFLQGDYELAIQNYDKAIALSPNAAEPYNGRGAAKSTLGQSRAALADFDQAIKLAPRSADAYSNRGNTRADLGDFKGAIDDCSRAIELDHGFASAYCNRSRAHHSLGDPKTAMADVDRALELDPTLAKAYNIRGALKYERGDLSGALADYERSIHYNPLDPQPQMNHGLVKADQGEHAAAIGDFNLAIELDPKYLAAYSGRANSAYNIQNWTRSLADFRKVLELTAAGVDTSYPRFYIWLIQARTNDRKAGSEALLKYFTERKGGNNDWEAAIGSFLLDYSTAAQLLKRAEDKNEAKDRGQKTEACFYIGSKNLIDGDKEAATKYFQQTVDMNVSAFFEWKSAVAELKVLRAEPKIEK